MPLGHRASCISAAVNLRLILVGIDFHVNIDGGSVDHRNPLATGEQFSSPVPMVRHVSEVQADSAHFDCDLVAGNAKGPKTLLITRKKVHCR